MSDEPKVTVRKLSDFRPLEANPNRFPAIAGVRAFLELFGLSAEEASSSVTCEVVSVQRIPCLLVETKQ